MQAMIVLRDCVAYLLTVIVVTSCTTINPEKSSTPSPLPTASPTTSTAADACPATEPQWIKPPDDSAVEGSPDYGYYFVNQDRSLWASAWWNGQEETYVRVGKTGVKVGWFRPAGAVLEITGRRLDGEASPLEAHVSCCYPTRFQATSLIFPTDGCWEVTARAAAKELSFVLKVSP
jgi:hypothetical protein